jgi:thiamine biosynthesis protein ThiS
MQIKVNGEPHILTAPASVAGLVDQLKLNLKQVAVEKNREIVPKSIYNEVMLSDGDEIEIVRFIGGG